MEINLSSKQFNKLFPFHILIDNELKIKGVGKSLEKICHLPLDASFFSLFEFKRPHIEAYTFDELKELVDQLIIVSYKDKSELLIRGQIEYLDDSDCLLLVVSPWFSSVDNLKEHNIGLNDFALHDSLIDLLHVFSVQQISNGDALELLEKVQSQKNDLKRMTLMIEENVNGVVITNAKGKIQWVNKAFENLTGYKLAEIVGNTPGSLLQGEDTSSETSAYLKEQIKNGLPFNCEIINYNKEKKPYWIRLSGQPILDKQGNVVQYFAFEENITDRKFAEQKLDDQRNFFEDVLNSIPSDIAVFDKNHRYLFLNPIAIKDPEIRKWMIGKKDEDYCAYRNRDWNVYKKRRDLFNHIIETKELYSKEEELINPNGQKEYYLRKMYPVLDDKGDVRLVIGYGLNITERKQIEQQLEKKEKSYRDLFNYSQALICTHDLNGKVLSVNPALCSTLGYTEAELIGKNLVDFIPQKDRINFNSLYLDKINHDEKASDVFRVIHKNGNILFLLYKNYRVEEVGEAPYVIGFSQDITDRIKAEQELLVAKKMSEDSARAKEVFLANMSHEIRTPMHGILGIAGLLAKSHLDEQQSNYVKLITESANNLVVIVNDILDIEKIGSGKMEFESLDFNLYDKLNTTLQSFQYKAEEKGIQLVLNADIHNDLYVKGDPYRLSQILNNLISNALKFTSQGKITVSCKLQMKDSDNLLGLFSVNDTGIGIRTDKMSVIFDPFVQASSDTTRKYGGTGLGLSICKNLVEMQGGYISVRSKEAVGTTFSFTIPYKLGQLAQEDESDFTQHLNMSALYKRILMAEDVVVNQFLAKVILEAGGFSVDIANNGKEAIELLNQNEYDLILMDIQMPEMDGINATKAIRKMEDVKKASIPIVALTANALVGNEQEYYDAGMNACLTKPFSENKLFAVMNKLLNPALFLQLNKG